MGGVPLTVSIFIVIEIYSEFVLIFHITCCRGFNLYCNRNLFRVCGRTGYDIPVESAVSIFIVIEIYSEMEKMILMEIHSHVSIFIVIEIYSETILQVSSVPETWFQSLL